MFAIGLGNDKFQGYYLLNQWLLMFVLWVEELFF